MQVIYPGHAYQLAHDGDHHVESLQFVNKVLKDGKLVIDSEGTTNEEVLRVLIDRMEYLQGELPCRDNEDALMHLRLALKAHDDRTGDRRARGVEGTNRK